MPARRLTGREMIIGVRTLLVRTRIYIRFPLVHRDGAGARFGLRLVDPVAVQVEPVVVRAAARPRLRVFQLLAVGVRHGAAVRIHPLRETADAVGIDHRVDQDDIVLQYLLRIGRPGRGQVIGQQQRRVESARLVAVDAVAEPVEHRPAGLPVGRRVAEQVVLRLDAVDIADVLFRRDDQQIERPALVRPAVLAQQHAVGSRGQRFHIGHPLLRRDLELPDLEAQHGRRRRDMLVIITGVRQEITQGYRILRSRAPREGQAQEKAE